MAVNRHPYTSSAGRPEAVHDDRDLHIKGLLTFVAVLVVVCAATFALIFGVFRIFQARENAEQVPLRAGQVANAHRMPPMPRLQSEPVADLNTVLAAEQAILNSYAWVDESKGVVRIPIGRAIGLLAQRGLPARAETPAPASSASVPTESGLGVNVDVPANFPERSPAH